MHALQQPQQCAQRIGTQRCMNRHRICMRASVKAYKAPSTRTAADELRALNQVTSLVPDQVLLETSVPPKAATVSCLVLNGIMGSDMLGMRPYQNAVVSALAYDKCAAFSGDANQQCVLDKAFANVGAMLSQQVEGRVATEIDPRLAHDRDGMVAKAQRLIELYTEMDVPKDKLIFRLPGTWEGIQAAKVLEQEGTPTQVFMIYSAIQGIAAAQAGVSVIQPNVGRTRDWYNRHPGVIRDPKGPREDTGFTSRIDPGIGLVTELYTYIKKYHPKTAVMASGIRTKEDALALSGIDYLVISARIMDALEAMPTMQGYNDGLRASTDEDGFQRQLSPEEAQAAAVREVPEVDQHTFNEQLGVAGSELLQVGIEGLQQDMKVLLPSLETRTVGNE